MSDNTQAMSLWATTLADSNFSDGNITLEICGDRQDQPAGGARRDRTDDLMLAKHALSQLSYGPEPVR